MQEYLAELLTALQDQPYLAVGFLGIYLLTCVLLLPGFILTYSAGVLFGPIYGLLMVSASATIGGSAAFLLGRFFLADRLRRRLKPGSFLAKLDAVIEPGDFWIVFLLRLCPIIPFRISNYALGMTRVSFKSFVIGTIFGTLPSAAVYVHAGLLVGNLAKLPTAGFLPESGALRFTFFAITLASFGMLSFFLSRYAKRALQDKVSEVPS